MFLLSQKNKKVNKNWVKNMVGTPKSSLFLGGSCIAAIAAVGSVFELSSGEPELGSLVTGVILSLSIPLAALLFYLAIQDAKANQ